MKKQTLKGQQSIDLTNTTPYISPTGGQVFAEGVILRKVSRFLSGGNTDGIMPIPCFYDVKTGDVVVDLLPKEIRNEYTLNETNQTESED